MSISSIDKFTINKLLNLVCNKLEIFGVIILLIGFFDVNFELVTWETTFNAVSYGILLFLLILRWKRCIYVATLDVSLLLLVAIFTLSYFWSASPENTLTFIRSVLRATFLGVYLASQYNYKELMRLYIWMFALALVINWVFAFFAITTGQSFLAIAQSNNESSWKCLLAHKQFLGRMMMYAAVIFLLSTLTDKRWRWLKYIGLSLSVILLFLSKSKTAWVLFLFSLALLPIMKLVKLEYKTRTLIYVVLALIVGSISVLLVSNYEFIVVDILRKPPDFNGRFEIWRLTLESGIKRFWFGYGLNGFWPSEEGLSVVYNTWGRSVINPNYVNLLHAHNGFIDIFLQLGIVGLFLSMFNFVALLKRLINLINVTKSVESFWMLEFFVLWFLFQMTERSTFLTPQTLYSMYLSIGLSTIIWQKRIKKNYNN
ncbi:MAG: O-antigen ligase family protein [Nostoc sp. SerVER01]|nr:O-antigen ligase family protein [Nostoc sp. SerVER01]